MGKGRKVRGHKSQEGGQQKIPQDNLLAVLVVFVVIPPEN